jgi:dTDP-glucose 4,6-dehydratase
LGWRAQETFGTGLRKTVQWCLNNKVWMDEVTSSSYQKWVNAKLRPSLESKERGR